LQSSNITSQFVARHVDCIKQTRACSWPPAATSMAPTPRSPSPRPHSPLIFPAICRRRVKMPAKIRDQTQTGSLRINPDSMSIDGSPPPFSGANATHTQELSVKQSSIHRDLKRTAVCITVVRATGHGSGATLQPVSSGPRLKETPRNAIYWLHVHTALITLCRQQNASLPSKREFAPPHATLVLILVCFGKKSKSEKRKASFPPRDWLDSAQQERLITHLALLLVVGLWHLFVLVHNDAVSASATHLKNPQSQLNVQVATPFPRCSSLSIVHRPSSIEPVNRPSPTTLASLMPPPPRVYRPAPPRCYSASKLASDGLTAAPNTSVHVTHCACRMAWI
jgi:hypothetical protein